MKLINDRSIEEHGLLQFYLMALEVITEEEPAIKPIEGENLLGLTNNDVKMTVDAQGKTWVNSDEDAVVNIAKIIRPVI